MIKKAIAVLCTLAMSFGSLLVHETSAYSTPEESLAALKKGEVLINPKMLNAHPRLLVGAEGVQAAAAELKANPAAYAHLKEQKDFLKKNPIPLELKIHGWDETKGLMLAAVLYVLTGEESQADAIHNWVVNGYTPGFITKPNLIVTPNYGTDNKDLAAGQLLYATAIIYDLLAGSKSYQDKYPNDLDALKKVLFAQGSQTYRDILSFKRHWYEQNHCYMLSVGLGMAAFALYEKVNELPEIAEWAVLTRNLLYRSKETLSSDGFYYESVGYWSGFFHFMTTYAEALKRMTGEDWLTPKKGEDPTLLTGLDAFLAHVSLPSPGKSFAFGDHGPRIAYKGYDRPVSELQIPLSIYPLINIMEIAPSDLAAHTIQTEWESIKMYEASYVNQSLNALTLLKLPSLRKALDAKYSLDGVSPWYYFEDHEYVFWRNAWKGDEAKKGAALATKCGPPEGHLAMKYIEKYPDWKLGMGHVHPDAGSFSIFAKGAYLASDPGYLGYKMTYAHNCILIDGKGQYKEGATWDTFSSAPYSKYDKLRFTEVWTASPVVATTADVTAAYDDALRLNNYERKLIMVDGRWLVVRDSISAPDTHVYSWVLNSEKPFRMAGDAKANRWLTECGEGRLIVQSLEAVDKNVMAPTWVNVDLTGKKEKEVWAVRENHLYLSYAATQAAVLTNVLCIQDLPDKASDFIATGDGKNAVKITEGKDRCLIFLGKEERFDGAFGYIAQNGEKIQSMGFSGTRMDLPGGKSFSLKSPAQISLKVSGGKWLLESNSEKSTTLTLESQGKELGTFGIPEGQNKQTVDLKL